MLGVVVNSVVGRPYDERRRADMAHHPEKRLFCDDGRSCDPSDDVVDPVASRERSFAALRMSNKPLMNILSQRRTSPRRPDSAIQEPHHELLLPEIGRTADPCLGRPSSASDPVQVGVEHGRVDVAPAADRRRVAEPLGDASRSRATTCVLGLGLRRRRGSNPGAPCGGQDGAGPGAEVLGGEVLAGDLAQVGVDVGRADRLRLAVVVEVLEQLLPGQVLAALDDRAPAAGRGRRSCAPCRSCRGSGSAASAPSTSTCSSRSVVRPNEPLARAYSSLPTRISVVSSSRTTAASTFSRGRPGRARSPSTRRADGAAAPRRRRSSGRTSSRRAPRASAGGSGTACGPWRRARSPGCGRRGAGQIQTSVQAGGMPSALIRASSFAVADRLAVEADVAEAACRRACGGCRDRCR